MKLLLGIPAGLLMIGVLVVVHEFGHFLFARLFGIGTPVFSVGVGHRIWGFKWRGTDFRLSALPFGGYVQMSGVDPFGEEDPESVWVAPEENFMKKPVWQRLIVMLAGPLFNLLLPIPLFVLVLMVGQPEADTVVGLVLPGTPAAEAGIQRGDRLVSVGGRELGVWADWSRMRDDLFDREVEVVYSRDGVERRASFPPGTFQPTFDGELDGPKFGLMHSRLSARVGVDDLSSPAGKAGIRTGDVIVEVDGVEIENWREAVEALRPGEVHTLKVDRYPRRDVTEQPPEGYEADELEIRLEPAPWTAPSDDPLVHPTWGLVPIQVYTSQIAKDSAALEAGLRAEDRLYSVDGAIIRSWSEITWLVAATVDQAGEDAEPRPLELVVIRDGAKVSTTFTPRLQRELVRGEPRFRPVMGVYPYGGQRVAGETTVHHYGVAEAVPLAVQHTWMTVRKMFRILGYLFVGDLKPQESVGGPLAMVQLATEAVDTGFWQLVELTALISVSLGIVNLLPVPVLDGGHIVFYTLEGLRGRPLPLALRERVQMIGVLVLGVVMLLVLVMDAARWLEGGIGS